MVCSGIPSVATNTKRVTTHQERWLCGTGRSSRCGASESGGPVCALHVSSIFQTQLVYCVFVSSVMGWYGMIWNVSHEFTFAPCQVKVSFWDLSVDRENVIRPPKTPPLAEFHGIGTYKTSMKNTTLQAMHHLRQPEGIEKKTHLFWWSQDTFDSLADRFSFARDPKDSSPNDIEVKTYESLSLAFDCTTVVQLGLGVKSEVLKSFQGQALGVLSHRIFPLNNWFFATEQKPCRLHQAPAGANLV